MKKEEEMVHSVAEDDEPRNETVGTYLKARRQARGLTLDDVATRTRIKIGYLEAIEADDYEALPSGPFVSGFITSYARALGIDPGEVESLIPEVEPPPIVDPAVRQDPDWKGPPLEIRELPVGGRGGALSAWGIAIAIALVVVAVVVFFTPSLQTWLGLDIDLTSAPAGEARDKGTPSTVSPSVAPTVEPKRKESATPKPEAQKGQSVGSSGGGTRVAIDSGGRTVASGGGEAAPGELKAHGIRRLAPILGSDDRSYVVYTDDSLPPGESQQIEIVARYKSYLRVSKTLEGDPIFEEVLSKEMSKRFTYPGDLWMVVGNSGGVDIYYNGTQLPALGKFGETKGVAFRLHGTK